MVSKCPHIMVVHMVVHVLTLFQSLKCAKSLKSLILSPIYIKPAPHADPLNSTRGTFSSLGADLRCYQLASLAEGKIKTYSSGEKQFTNFYYQFHLHKHVPLLQTMENILIYFAVFLAKMVTPDTIKVDLATVRHMHLVNSYNLRITKFQCLHYILRGIK